MSESLQADFWLISAPSALEPTLEALGAMQNLFHGMAGAKRNKATTF